jgi:hypothetical protein
VIKASEWLRVLEGDLIELEVTKIIRRGSDDEVGEGFNVEMDVAAFGNILLAFELECGRKTPSERMTIPDTFCTAQAKTSCKTYFLKKN